MSFNKNYTYFNLDEPGSLNPKSGSGEFSKNNYIALVTDNNDPNDLGRIKVKIPTVDIEPQWAFPILPKYLHMIPQVDEAVLITIPNPDKPNIERYYYPSIISNLPKIKKDDWFKNIKNKQAFQIVPESNDTKLSPETENLFPSKNDIGIIGRNNTDIILKDEQIIFRVGKHLTDTVLTPNNKNPASLSLNYNLEKSYIINEADIVYLLSHEGANRVDKYYDKSNIESLYNKTKPTLYGDETYNLLVLIIDAVIEHEHPFAGIKPLSNGAIEKLKQFKKELILNQKVRTN